jgi:hypothetical protein
MSYPTLLPEVEEVLDELIASLGDDLRAVYWQGSWARGEAKPWSDHDLIIVMKRLDDDLLLRLKSIFSGRKEWSTYVRTEAELRQHPSEGRPQFHFGLIPLYGEFEAPPMEREHIIDELRILALNISFEARYRLYHREPLYDEMDEHWAGFLSQRTVRLLRYSAKLAILAMKARELLEDREYPVTSAALRPRITDPDELWIIDAVERWSEVQPDFLRDPDPLCLRLDAFSRNLVAWLDTELRAP